MIHLRRPTPEMRRESEAGREKERGRGDMTPRLNRERQIPGRDRMWRTSPSPGRGPVRGETETGGRDLAAGESRRIRGGREGAAAGSRIGGGGGPGPGPGSLRKVKLRVEDQLCLPGRKTSC